MKYCGNIGIKVNTTVNAHVKSRKMTRPTDVKHTRGSIHPAHAVSRLPDGPPEGFTVCTRPPSLNRVSLNERAVCSGVLTHGRVSPED